LEGLRKSPASATQSLFQMVPNLTSCQLSWTWINSSGGCDWTKVLLTEGDGLDVTITPASRTATLGATITYTLVISNCPG